MRNRRTKKRKNAVSRRLHDVPVVTANGIDHQAECGVDDGAGFLWIEVLLDAGRVDDVDKEGRYQLALAFGNEAVVDRLTNRDAGALRRCGLWRGGEGGAALVAEARTWTVRFPAFAAVDW